MVYCLNDLIGILRGAVTVIVKVQQFTATRLWDQQYKLRYHLAETTWVQYGLRHLHLAWPG